MSKVIVITGAGSGLGKSLALRFAADGESVVLLGRTLAKIEKVAQEAVGNALAIQCDVGNPDSVREAFAKIAQRHPKIDVLINNAAFIGICLLTEASDSHILETINTNLGGALFCSRSAIGVMERGGHIINVSSESLETPFPHHVAYQSSKGGIEAMTTHLQKELDPQGIRVSVVRAGQMVDETPAWDEVPPSIVAFFTAAKERGIDLMQRPISSFKAVTDVFRSLIDLPPDVQVTTVRFIARHP